MNKKKILIICAALLLVVVAMTLLFSNKYEPPFWVKQEIEENWEAAMGVPFDRWLDISSGTDSGVRYYGMYNGYYILFDGSGMRMAVYTAIHFGTETIDDGASFGIYAYKDGTFIDLKDAYDMGYLSDNHISKIANKHRKTTKELYQWLYAKS